jgi:hypothetical protein
MQIDIKLPEEIELLKIEAQEIKTKLWTGGGT